jgi:putative hydrolase of HD superfamily
MMVPCLNADILYLFFDSANMHRWNDHLRPVDLTEIDKQAHKAMIAWVLASYEEAAGNSIDWPVLIEHGMFSFIQRAVLTDLKPQVFHKIVAERRGQVADYVISEFDRLVPDADPRLRGRFREYLYDEPRTKEDAVLRAAHYIEPGGSSTSSTIPTAPSTASTARGRRSTSRSTSTRTWSE